MQSTAQTCQKKTQTELSIFDFQDESLRAVSLERAKVDHEERDIGQSKQSAESEENPRDEVQKDEKIKTQRGEQRQKKRISKVVVKIRNKMEEAESIETPREERVGPDSSIWMWRTKLEIIDRKESHDAQQETIQTDWIKEEKREQKRDALERISIPRALRGTKSHKMLSVGVNLKAFAGKSQEATVTTTR